MGNCNRNSTEFSQNIVDTSYLEKPICYIGLIETSSGYYSNGILIDKNIVLTASRILYDPETNNTLPPNELKFIPAKNGNSFPFGSINIIDYYIHDDKNTKIDKWCILYLSKSVGYDINIKFYKAFYYKLCVFSEKILNEKLAFAYFYNESINFNNVIVEACGNLDISPEGYNFKTGLEIGGSPLFIIINGKKKLFSIECSLNPHVNSARIFKYEDLKMIKLKTKEFNLKYNGKVEVIPLVPFKSFNSSEEIKNEFHKEMLYNPVFNTNEKPYLYVGLILKNCFCATGFLIDKNIVITTARVLYDLETKIETRIEDLQFKIQINNKILTSKIKDYYFSENYKLSSQNVVISSKNSTPDESYPWGLLYLNTNIVDEIFNGKNQKYYKTIELDDDELEGKFVNIYYYSKYKNKFVMNKSTGNIKIHKNNFSYKLKNFSKKFSFGGPILVELNEKKYLIGFNSDAKREYLIGHRFTQNDLSEISKQIKKFKETYEISTEMLERKSTKSIINRISTNFNKITPTSNSLILPVNIKDKIILFLHLKKYFNQDDVFLILTLTEINIWKIGTSKLLGKINYTQDSQNDLLIQLLNYNETNDIIAHVQINYIRLYSLSIEKELFKISINSKQTSMIYLGDNKQCLITGSLEGSIKIWDLKTKSSRSIISAHENFILTLCSITDYGSNNYFASGSSDYFIYIWDYTLMKRYKILKGHKNSVLSLHYTINFTEKDILFSGSIKDIKIWKIPLGVCMKTINVFSQNKGIYYISSFFSEKQKNSFIVCANDNVDKVRILDIRNSKHVIKFKREDKSKFCLIKLMDYQKLCFITCDMKNNITLKEKNF